MLALRSDCVKAALVLKVVSVYSDPSGVRAPPRGKGISRKTKRGMAILTIPCTPPEIHDGRVCR
jgi:hypothetical protein